MGGFGGGAGVRTLLVVSMATAGGACTFPHGHASFCTEFENAPITPLTSQSSQMVFETPGTVIAFHGFGSANLASGQGGGIRVEQSQEIPAYANRATVFLNGWRAAYAGTDHNVGGLFTMIGAVDVDLRERRVKWNAVGVLQDDSEKQGFGWTYAFTVLAWRDASLQAVVDNGSFLPDRKLCTPDGDFTDNYFYDNNADTNTALASFYSFLQNPIFAGSRPVAILPRGFGFLWHGGDHNLRQVAYNLDHSEAFVQKGLVYRKQREKTFAPLPPPGTFSQVGAGFASWSTSTIFKDNAARRGYNVSEVVSAIGGADVGVVQPPYAILPADEGSGLFGGCGELGDNEGIRSEDFSVRGIPFLHAVPVLVGWDLEFLCDDENVKEIGIWIESWNYEGPGGSLNYQVQSVLRDKNERPGFGSNYKVMILGLRPTNVISPGGGQL